MSTPLLPDPNAQQALLEQLVDASQRNADTIANLDGALAALRAQLAQAAAIDREREQSEHRRGEQLERLAAEVDRLRADRSMATQLEALSAQQVRLADRTEQLAVELRRLDQLQSSLEQLGRELAGEIAGRDHALRGEMQAQSRGRTEEAERLGRMVQGLLARDEQITSAVRALETLGRQQTDVVRQLQTQEARLDGLGTSLGERDEGSRLLEQRLRASFLELRAQLQTLEGAVAGWQGHLEEQTETLREARGLVDLARAEAGRLRVEHHATTEELRVAAQRVDAALADLRQEIANRWELFLNSRRQDWSSLSLERETERRALAEALTALRSSIEAELLMLSEGLSAGLELGRQDLDSLRHRMGTFLRALHDTVMAGNMSFEVDLPSGDPGAQAPERRQALRRALRARRQAGGGGGP